MGEFRVKPSVRHDSLQGYVCDNTRPVAKAA